MSCNYDSLITYMEFFNNDHTSISVLSKYSSFDLNKMKKDIYDFFINYLGSKYGDLVKQIADKYYNEKRTIEYIKNDQNIDEGVFIFENTNYDNGIYTFFEIYEKKEYNTNDGWFLGSERKTSFEKIGKLSYLEIYNHEDIKADLYTFSLCLFERLYPKENINIIKKLCDEVGDINDIKNNTHRKNGPYLLVNNKEYVIYKKESKNVDNWFSSVSISKMIELHKINDDYYNKEIIKNNLFSDNKEIIWRILKILNKKRYDNIIDKTNLKTIIYNIDINMGSKIDKNIPLIKNKKLSPSTLHLWAEEDNYIEYNKLMALILRDLIKDDCSFDNIVNIIYKLFEHKLTYLSISSGTGCWLYFDNGVWKKKNTSEMNKIIIDKLNDLKTVYKCSNIVDDSEKNKILLYFKSILSKLTNNNLLDSINNKLKEKLSNSQITNKNISLNPFKVITKDNINLVCFNNGVYDIEKRHFRSILYDDYITNSTGYNWIDYKDNKKEINNLENFLCDLCGCKVDNAYILKMLAHNFSNKNNKDINIWFTEDRRMKKLLGEILKVYGDYKKDCFIDRSRNDIFNLNTDNKVLCIHVDDSKNSCLIMKGCYDAIQNNICKSNVLFITESVLKAECDDEIWENIKIYPWGKKLVTIKECTKDNKNLKKDEILIDDNFINEFHKRLPLLAWLLLTKYYSYIDTIGLNNTISATTLNWKKYNDPLYAFEKGYFIINDSDLDANVSIDKCYKVFCEFLDAYHPNKSYSKKEFIKYLEKQAYFIHNDLLYGIGLVDE